MKIRTEDFTSYIPFYSKGGGYIESANQYYIWTKHFSINKSFRDLVLGQLYL